MLAPCTLEQFETEFAGRHLIHGALAYWTARRPHDIALINHNLSQSIDWDTFDRATAALAFRLLELGFRKGDFLATSLPLLTGHIFLEYACFRIGVIHAPLDLRLKPAEVLRSLAQIRARGYAFLGSTPAADFRELGRAVQAQCPSVEFFLQFSPPEDLIPGALSAFSLLASPPPTPAQLQLLAEASSLVSEHDPAQVIFTTGSTGPPKAALLSHRGITCQNMCLGAGFGFDAASRVLVNLPPSHVGCQSELLMTTLFSGGTAVFLEIFDPARSLEAIARHRVNLLGQIPAMFQMEWRLSDYSRYDLSSLQFAAYGGQQAPRSFLDRLAAMAPRVGTGLGLTEASGFCTYTAPDASLDDIAAGLGHAMPVYPMSIRQPMRDDGRAGDELPQGEIGHVTFRGPQTFLGYVNDPAATARAISTDGYLYTGDMGSLGAAGLHFAGRSRWILKPAGYQVFPGDIEAVLASLDDKVAVCGVAGAPHAVRSEGIIAFVEKRPGADLTVAELKARARALAGYMRPLHYVILEPGQMPLNRTAKVDYLRLSEMALEEAARLRAARRWDR